MFEGDSALKKIGVLSGGEKSRVLIGKLLATPVNLLLLDEPTNHFDMESCDALLAALDSFEGAIIMVTHNEMFLDALAERLIVFQDDNVHVFEGSYQRFLEKEGWKEEKNTEPNLNIGSKVNKKELRRLRSDIITEKSKVLNPIERKISKTENEIEILEKELSSCMEAIRKASEDKTGKKIAEISKAIHTCQTSIDRFFNELEVLTDELEEKSAVFEERLKQIELSED